MKIFFLIATYLTFGLGYSLKTEGTSPKKIALCITATGKYNTFANKLILSAKEHFLKDQDVTYLVFADQEIIQDPSVKKIQQKRLGWPFDTLMRFKLYLNQKDELEKYDYIFALDADMLFVSDVGDEILSDLVGTTHPGYYNSKGTYETRRKSTAFVPKRERKVYFAGGFYGGKRDNFLHLLKTTTEKIDKDLEKNFIAIWHDESHLNRYFVDFPPTLILDASYCYPETWNIPFHKRIIALDKNHDEIRS